MKKCKYCNNICDINETVCPSCGSASFKYVCDNCSNEFDNGMYCPMCGVKVGQKEKICPHCGNHYFTNACPNCGYIGQAPGHQDPEKDRVSFEEPNRAEFASAEKGKKPKNKLISLLLCIFLGFYGAHLFYEEKFGLGFVYIFTGGLFLIGWFIDIVRIASKPSIYYV